MRFMSQIASFKDLKVWQKAFDVCFEVYGATRGFPTDERYGLAAELRKTARSVVWNIAEGSRRRSTVEYIRFLDIASGSAAELEAQLMLADRLGYFEKEQGLIFLRSLDEIERMLRGLMKKLGEPSSSSSSSP